MFTSISGTTQQYLASLAKVQKQLQNAQSQITSGLRVQQASDDPAAVSEILQIQASIAHNKQIQSNLSGVKNEVDTADSVLQVAVQAVESAVSIAAQGAGSSTSAITRATLAEQVKALQQSLVGISQTSINGHYIFSGDQDTQPPYQYDPNQPNGVTQVVTGNSTRTIQSVDGTSFAVAKTAQDIFDARNPDSTPAAGNIFAALQSLYNGLVNNDTAAITAASDSLKAGDTHLNGQLAFYGQVETRIQSATDLAQKFSTTQATDLGQVRDPDVPTLATQLTQLQNQQQASMTVVANLSRMKTLFDMLG